MFIAPTFKDAKSRSDCGCEYYPDAAFVGGEVYMTIKPVGNNLTIKWWTANANPIVGNDGQYFLENNNRVRLIIF